MNDIVIKLENLSKVYKLYDHPLDRLKESLHPFGKKYHYDYYALDNINLEIRRGDTVGIIGRNGAGKSTLLKMITGILTPTSGTVHVNGRIASLLELGAGFNPEMTGLENIFFSGTIMGFTHKEMETKLEAILAFADIGDFIHQPVKTYSSGMYVRLAFALNTVIEPDILIVDEALAVGDAIFVQKCMRYIRNFIENGTLIFVSHDLASIKNICKKAIWLQDSKILKLDTAEAVCNSYLEFTYQKDLEMFPIQNSKNINIELNNAINTQNNLHNANGFTTGKAEILSVQLCNFETQGQIHSFEGGEKIRLNISAIAKDRLENPILGFIVKDHLGQELFGENTIAYTKENRFIVEGGTSFNAEFIFRMPRLQNGQYSMMLSLAEGDNFDHIQHHLLYDAYIINVNSNEITFGIMNITFESVKIFFQ